MVRFAASYAAPVAVLLGLSGCLPAVSVVEGVKQLGSYGVDQALSTEDEFLKNYTDRQVCLSATLSNLEWDESIAAKPFVREAARRDLAKDCRKEYTKTS